MTQVKSNKLKMQCERVLGQTISRIEATDHTDIVCCVTAKGLAFVNVKTSTKVHPSQAMISGGTQAVAAVVAKGKKEKRRKRWGKP